MDYHNPKLIIDTAQQPHGQAAWRSPSNIALIKYWGKYGQQLPRNPSVSFTLSTAATTTAMQYATRTSDAAVSLDFYFGGQPRPDFSAKVEKYLHSLLPVFPFIKQLHFRIDTDNSFPHSAGIASSASAMSALALCLCSVERALFGTLGQEADFLQKASYLARLGSGSACRSVYPRLAAWGATTDLPAASNEYAVPLGDDVHPVFKTFHDDILIISRAEKSVSSRAGHGLMEGNRYADSRYAQARQRFTDLLAALRTGDLDTFGQITEAEALTLHALMMTSLPPYLLMEPNTIAAIRKVQQWRHDTGLPLYFTLDAGPNLHLLYPDSIASQAAQFIQQELAPLCQDGHIIRDVCGPGPEELVP